jgi:hypothetical protein
VLKETLTNDKRKQFHSLVPVTKKTKRLIGASLFLLFIGGAILVPVFHEIHCADHHADHDPATCSICQFASTPSLAPASHAAPAGESILLGDVAVQVPTVVLVSLRDPTQARAPPAC